MSFKKDFVWGAATASYQIEGAADEDGRGPSIWDEFSHTEGKVFQGHTGDFACDHYHRFKEDVKTMSELGLKAYRFSISWSRIIPDGSGEVNQKGIDFYNALIDELVKYGIEPYVTLYHWDLPYALHLKGGWLNDDISDLFEKYTRIVAENFGDRVKNFITFNEPQVFVGCGYMQGSHAPGYKLDTRELLHIGHNVLKSHGKAVRVLREAIPGVKIGFTCATSPACPQSEKDVEAARESYFYCGKAHFVFSDPFWLDTIVFGKYPQRLLDECKDIMPEVTDEDMKLIGAPIDFIGLNIYFGRNVRLNEKGELENLQLPVGFPRTAIKWGILPPTLYWGPRFHFDRYKLPIYITENGMSAHDVISLDGKVHDPNRIDFLNRYLLELRRAATDGVDVGGYFQWSLMDNFEWSEGYNERFGIIYVDYATGERTIKDSAYWYKDVIESNGENL
ncbi:MAG: beta-glucosidase [Oscillospiraceae bacterium]|nr:beta-glucosidase [Oscillospiraceae bacterium]